MNTPTDHADRRCVWGIAIAALVAYGAAGIGVFVYDDLHSVRDNTALRELANVPQFFGDVSMFSAFDMRMYRPVLLTSFALNHAIGGVEPWIYKLTNVLLHAATAVMLFGLARRLGLRRGAALTAGVLLAVHPLCSETINMISGRSELLLVTALIAGAHCHLSAMQGRRYAGVAVAMCAVVACGSKETGVIMPVLMLVLELVRPAASRTPVALATRFVPTLAVVAGYLVVRRSLLGVATVTVPVLQGGSDPLNGAGRDLVTQLATMAVALPGCMSQFALPLGLTLDPPVEFHSQWSWQVGLGCLLLLGLTAYGLHAPRRRPALFFATALAWGTALPWILIPLNVPLSEHRYYGSVAGLSLVIAALWPAAWRHAPRLRVPALVVLVGFAAIAAERSAAYRSETELWRRAAVVNPDSYRACHGLGACLMNDGQLAQAKPWMERALTLYPGYVSTRRNLAELHLQMADDGDPATAVELACGLVDVDPTNPFYRLLLSRALAARGHRVGAANDFDAAVEQALYVNRHYPPKALTYRTAAHARRTQGDFAAALELLDVCLEHGLDYTSVRLERHELLLQLNRRAEAEVELHQVLAADPFEPQARAALLRLRPDLAPQPQ